MLYPKNIADKLSFSLILEKGEAHCESALGRTHFKKIKFVGDRKLIAMHLEQVNEVKEMLTAGGLNPALGLDFDLKYEQAKAKGFYYAEEDLAHIYDALLSIEKVVSYFQDKVETFPRLTSLFANVDINFGLLNEISQVLGAEGAIKDNATPKYQKINAKIRSKEKSILSSSQRLFTKNKESGFLADTELGIKNGRVVLPVLSEYKRKVDGLLIDQSNTGRISYIEPLELVNLNNELSELFIEKRQELIAILKAISAKVVVELSGIRSGIQKLSVYDFIRAKARLARDFNAVLPKLGNKTRVSNARHPILEERLREEKGKIIPLAYDLDAKQRLIVISGPNAGGKSVALKTVGLLQYMLQCGFLISCDPSSEFQLFEHIFIDIGDNQSIESDLSTYSAHLKAAKHIINFCDEQTLVLMDEIGTGTDPTFGGPMAEAILNEIHDRKAYGVITTHFSNIKTRVETLKHAVNAAMLFDVDSLSPLYQLQLGTPGSSFSFEVATKIGLNKKVVKKAKSLTNTSEYDYDKLLSEMQTEKEEVEQLKAQLNTQLAKSAAMEDEYRELKSRIESNEKVIINQAKSEAKDILQNSNKVVEETIRKIKESNADKEKTLAARKQLENEKKSKEIGPIPVDKIKTDSDIKVGDRVQIGESENFGEVLEIKKNSATVSVGSIKTKTNVKNLRKVGATTAKKVKKYISTSSYNQKQEKFKTELDVRGFRTEEALREVDQWIDSALILGYTSLRLIHGKGHGILKDRIWQHLKPNTAVAKISFEHVELGGSGVSIIELK